MSRTQKKSASRQNKQHHHHVPHYCIAAQTSCLKQLVGKDNTLPKNQFDYYLLLVLDRHSLPTDSYKLFQARMWKLERWVGVDGGEVRLLVGGHSPGERDGRHDVDDHVDVDDGEDAAHICHMFKRSRVLFQQLFIVIFNVGLISEIYIEIQMQRLNRSSSPSALRLLWWLSCDPGKAG